MRCFFFLLQLTFVRLSPTNWAQFVRNWNNIKYHILVAIIKPLILLFVVDDELIILSGYKADGMEQEGRILSYGWFENAIYWITLSGW